MSAKPALKDRIITFEEEQEIAESDGNVSSSETSESSEEPEMLANTREKRYNAGAKMSKLLESEYTDDFYQSTYGGFFDEETDAPYKSPAESDSDEIDSDFDKPESDDEPISDEEFSSLKRRRITKRHIYKEPKLHPMKDENICSILSMERKSRKLSILKSKDMPATANKLRSSTLQKSAIARHHWRIGNDTKHKLKAKFRTHGSKDEHQLTQSELLAEAKLTELANKKSLENYQLHELEQRQKRDRASKKREIDGPRIRYISMTMLENDSPDATLCSRTFIEFPNEHLLEQSVLRRRSRSARFPHSTPLCCVTSHPANYRDPVTELPFASTADFRQLRTRYESFLMSVDAKQSPSSACSSSLADWLNWRQRRFNP